MAIEFSGAGAEASAASGGLTLNAPASPQSGDIWIAVIHVSDQGAISMSGDWTQIFQANGGGTTSRLAAFWHRYAGSAPSLAVTHSGGQSPIGGIASFRGCIASGNPVNTTGSGGAGTDASIEISGFTPTASSMLVVCDGAADDNTRSTLPSGFTAGFEDSGAGVQSCYVTTAGNPDGSVACHYKLHTSGATGNFTDTMAASDPWASVMFALTPAPDNLSITCVAGTIDTAGQSAGVQPGAVFVQAVADVIDAAGHASSVTAVFPPVVVTCGVGTVVTAGQAADVQPGAVTVQSVFAVVATAGPPADIQPGAVSVQSVVGLVGTSGLSAVVSIASSPISITCGADTISVAGISGGVQPGSVSVQAVLGQAQAAGATADIQPGAVSVVLSSGNVLLAGQTGAVQAGSVTISVQSASLSTAGQAADAQPGAVSVGISSGTISLSGIQGDTQPGAVTIQASSGQALVSGYTAQAGSITVISVSAGSVAAAGQQADVQAGAVSVLTQPGSLGVTGYSSQVVVVSAATVQARTAGIQVTGWDVYFEVNIPGDVEVAEVEVMSIDVERLEIWDVSTTELAAGVVTAEEIHFGLSVSRTALWDIEIEEQEL